jgi:hypothetical protein
MVRRIAVVAVLVGAGLAVAPSSASAEDLCQTVAYNGVTTATVGPDCIRYDAARDCSSGPILLGVLGTVWYNVCLPAL